MKWRVGVVGLLLCVTGEGQTEGEVKGKVHPAPAEIVMGELKEAAALDEPRRRVIEVALDILEKCDWLPYVEGGDDPSAGGFDCSGAVYHVLRKCGLEPPRSSARQYDWLKSGGRLHEVPAGAKDAEDASLAHLRPGDLLFWAVDEKSGPRIHHVAIYLGKERKDGRPVMINATDGRSYRGKQANGYGVYDFRVPKAGSRSRLVGYGTPPGIPEG